MTRIRLTREQSRDQTRQRLMDAAQAIFIQRGVSAASVEEIADAAGYTRGAFYSNFDSKLELFLELLRRDHDQVLLGMQAIFTEEASATDLEARILQYYSSIYRDNKCFLLWVEARMQAVRDPNFKMRFAQFVREKREAIIDYIDQFSARTGTPLPLPSKHLALGLVALCDGMQFFHILDPGDVPGELVESVLDGFFRKVAFGA